eukprot:snap_masked-scaffold_133-processed-gene-0.5-mRNA-1 protein AED:1.00 eAED:1.00 QI:0/0/0/0/1/1/2/0/380
MTTRCFELFPVGKCGLHGTCVVVDSPDNSTFQEICVCEPGWSQSKEMSLYFLDEEDIEDRELGLCTQNISVLTTIITKKKQVIRLLPLLPGFLMHIFLDVYKLSNIQEVNLGEDPLFTAVFRNMELLHIFSITTFFQKYISYILKGTHLGNQELIKKAKLFSTISNYVLFTDIIIYQVFWITIFMPRKTGYTVIKICFGLTLFRTLYTFFMVYKLFGTIIRDLRSYLNLVKSLSNSQETEKRINLAKKNLIKLTTLRKMSYFYGFMCFMFLNLPAIFPFVMYTLGYQIPLLFIVWSILSIVAANIGKKRKASSSDSSTKINRNRGIGNRFTSLTEKSLINFNVRMRANTEELVDRLRQVLPARTEREILYERRSTGEKFI